MASSNNPKCCDRFMLRVVGESFFWACPRCGTRKDEVGLITSLDESGLPGSPHFDGRTVLKRSARPDEVPDSEEPVEYPKADKGDTSRVTDHEPRCWKCGRVLGKFFSRPWSLRYRRCKANNTGVLRGADT